MARLSFFFLFLLYAVYENTDVLNAIRHFWTWFDHVTPLRTKSCTVSFSECAHGKCLNQRRSNREIPTNQSLQSLGKSCYWYCRLVLLKWHFSFETFYSSVSLFNSVSTSKGFFILHRITFKSYLSSSGRWSLL